MIRRRPAQSQTQTRHSARLAATHPAWPAFGRRYFSPEVAAAKLSSPSKDHVMRLSQQLYLKQVGTAFVSICVGISLYSATMN